MLFEMRRLEALLKMSPLPPGVEWLPGGDPLVMSHSNAAGENRLVAYLSHIKLPPGTLVDGMNAAGVPPHLYVRKIDLGPVRELKPTIALDEEWLLKEAAALLHDVEAGTAVEVQDCGELP